MSEALIVITMAPRTTGAATGRSSARAGRPGPSPSRSRRSDRAPPTGRAEVGAAQPRSDRRDGELVAVKVAPFGPGATNGPR